MFATRAFVVFLLSIKKRKRQVTARYVTLSIVVKSCIEVQYANETKRNASQEYREGENYMLSRCCRFSFSLRRASFARSSSILAVTYREIRTRLHESQLCTKIVGAPDYK